MFIKYIQRVYSHQFRSGHQCRNLCSGRRSGSKFPRSDSHSIGCILDLLTQYVGAYTSLYNIKEFTCRIVFMCGKEVAISAYARTMRQHCINALPFRVTGEGPRLSSGFRIIYLQLKVRRVRRATTANL